MLQTKKVNGLPVGQGVNGNQVFLDKARIEKHMQLLGASGSGKSKFLEYFSRFPIFNSDYGMIMIDPHGSLFEAIRIFLADKLPLAKRVIFLDITDPDCVGFSPIPKDSKHPDFIVESLVSSTFKAWGQDDLEYPRINRWLRNIYWLLVANGLVFTEIEEILINRDYRKQLLKNPSIPTFVRADWQGFESLSATRKSEMLEGVENRLRSFLSSQSIKNILSRPYPISIDQVMAEGKILLINLNGRNVVTKEASKLLGVLKLSEIHRCAKNRNPHIKLKPCFVVVDEFAQFVSRDIANSLDELRKFKIFMMLAHQHLAQLSEEDEYLYASVMTNCKNKMVFGGLSNDDIKIMSEELVMGHLDLMKIKHTQYATKVKHIEEMRETKSKSIGSSKTSTSGKSRSLGKSESQSSAKTNGISTTFSSGRTKSHSNSQSNGVSENIGQSSGVSNSLSKGITKGRQQGQSVSNGTSKGQTKSKGKSSSETSGTSQTNGTSSSEGQSQSKSNSFSKSNQNSKSTTDTRSSGNSFGSSQGNTESRGRSQGNNMHYDDGYYRQGMSRNDSTQRGDSSSNSQNFSSSNSHTSGMSESSSTTFTDGSSDTQGTNKSQTTSQSTAKSKSETTSSSESTAESTSETQSKALSKGSSVSNSFGKALSQNKSQSRAKGRSQTINESDAIGKSSTKSNGKNFSLSQNKSASKSLTEGQNKSESQGISTGKSVSVSPFLKPEYYQEVSSVQFWNIEEQLFDFSQKLKTQNPGECVLKLGNQEPIPVKLKFIPDIELNKAILRGMELFEQRIKRYNPFLFKKLETKEDINDKVEKSEDKEKMTVSRFN